eukprot:422971-Pyramimonas_sp.AAC.1
MTCRHPAIAEYYNTAKHNAAGRQILHFPKEGRTGQIRHTDELWENRRRPGTANGARLDAWGGGKEKDNGEAQGGQRDKA